MSARHMPDGTVPDTVDSTVDTTAIALAAVSVGWPLTPVKPGTKRPLRPGWQRREQAVTTREQVLAAVREHGPCSWGLLPAYGGLVLVDLDRLVEAAELLQGEFGIDLSALLAQPGTRIRSGNPGHDKRLYRMPPGMTAADFPTCKLFSPVDRGTVLELRCSDARGHSVQDLIAGRHPSGSWYSLELVVEGEGSIWAPPVLPDAWVALWLALREAGAKATPGADARRDVDDLALAVTMRRATADTVEDLRSALAHIGTVHYPEWSTYSLALRALADNREDLAEAVHAAWLEWTLASDRYGPGDEDKWDGGFADARGAVTYLTVFHAAAGRGWHNPRRRVAQVVDSLFEEVEAGGEIPHAEPAPPAEDPWAALDTALTEPEPQHPGAATSGPTPAPTPLNPFEPLPLTAVLAEPEQRWWIKTVLPEAELAAIIGARASGKTFFALDALLHVAHGWPWRGLRTRQTPVCVIAGEGYRGLVKRLRALCQHHGLDPAKVPIDIVKVPPSLLDPAQVRLLLQGLRAGAVRWGQPYGIVLVDTLATSMPGGNENASEDMGRVIAACKVLHQRLGALIWLVHHLGKDAERGARGWSGLGAALDAEITVTRPEADQPLRVAKLTKSKDSVDGVTWAFELEGVRLGTDADGDPITTARVVTVDLADPAGNRRRQGERLRGNRRAVWDAFEALRGEHVGEAVPIGVLIERAIALRGDPPPVEGRDRRPEVMRRALHDNVDAGLLASDGRCVRAQRGAELFVDVPEEGVE